MIVFILACTPSTPPEPVPPRDPAPEVVAEWPNEGAPLKVPLIEAASGTSKVRLFLSAGHGAPGNAGNTGVECQREEDFALTATRDLADRLRATGRFEVTEARTGADRPTYSARLAHLNTSGADLFIEIHSDARGDTPETVGTSPDGHPCLRQDEAPGVAVLLRDEGPLKGARLRLARSVAKALADAGFAMFDGVEYKDLYEHDPTAGVFLDRRGLMMLRRPEVPSIIIETHHARDPREVARWKEPRTYEAFAAAVGVGVLNAVP